MIDIDPTEQLILEGLDKQGILCQLKAQMRATVYKLIDSASRQMKGKNDFSWENSKASQLSKNPQMKSIIEIFVEFLQFYNLHYTLSVFKQELNADYDIKRDNLIQRLNFKKNDVAQDESLIQYLVNDYFGGGRKNEPLSFKKDKNNEAQNLEVKLSGQENKQPLKVEKDVKQMKKQQEPKTKFELKPITDKLPASLPAKNLPPLIGQKQQQQQPQQQKQQQQSGAYDFDIEDSDESLKNAQKPVTKYNSFTPAQQQQQQQSTQFNKKQDVKEDNPYEEEISESIQYEDEPFENPSQGSESAQKSNQYQPPSNLPTNIQKQVYQQQQQLNQFASSEDYGSQSQGMDLTVDSVKLEEYDLVEDVQLVSKKKYGF